MILVSNQNNATFRKATPAMNDPMLPLPGLSSVSGKNVIAKFDGGLLSSDGGILTLREIEGRLCVAERMAACIQDPRASHHVTHSMAEIIRFRLLMIAAGYEDGNDADSLRSDPMFKMALDLTPSDRELCSRPTISRLENLPDAGALLRMGRAMVDLYCESYSKVPKRIVLDIDDTFDASSANRDSVNLRSWFCDRRKRKVPLPFSNFFKPPFDDFLVGRGSCPVVERQNHIPHPPEFSHWLPGCSRRHFLR